MRQILEQHVLQEIDMEMDHVELPGSIPHLVQHHEVTGGMIPDPRKPQRLGNAGNEFRGRPGIAASEQSHVMALTHELLGEPGDHPFRAPVEFRGNGLRQGGDLGNSHHDISVAAGLSEPAERQPATEMTVPQVRQLTRAGSADGASEIHLPHATAHPGTIADLGLLNFDPRGWLSTCARPLSRSIQTAPESFFRKVKHGRQS